MRPTDATYEVYSDPDFVQAFVSRAEITDVIERRAAEFVQQLPGKRVIDVGCGPGIHSWYLAGLGLSMVGIDYSEAMIEEARRQAGDCAGNLPEFQVLDMRGLGKAFPADSFDGAWISASLLHISETDVPAVLAGLHSILVDGGLVRIALKGGVQGPRLVEDGKFASSGFDRTVTREFIFWEKERFAALLAGSGFEIVDVEETQYGTTGGEPTHWLSFTAISRK